MNMNYENLPEYLSISQMAKLLNLSRSRIYQLIEQNILLKPVYLISNKRPVYTKEMAIVNLEVKGRNQGINGQVLMFYTARNIDRVIPSKKVKKSPQSDTQNSQYTDLIDALESLGLEGITPAQIDSAMRACFPTTVPDSSDDEKLTTVFRYLKRQNTEHKPRT